MNAPTCHLNGTGQERLLANAMGALEAVQTAQTKLQEVYPNARDYYVQPQGEEACRAAVQQYLDMARKLEAVEKELIELAYNISQQGSPTSS